MRIAVISDAVLSTPSPDGHGLGRVVSIVSEGLLARGHDLTLFAKLGSQFSGKLITPVGAEGYEGEWLLARAAHQEHRKHPFDVFVSNDHLHVLSDLFTNLPVVNIYNDNYQAYRRCAVLLSTGQRALMPSEFENARIIPNALNIADFEPQYSPDPQDYALFLGVLSSIKQPMLAIEACAKAGVKLVVAGKTLTGELPFTPNDRVQYLGPISGKLKADVLKGARLLLQLGTVESFGLTTLEANLSGVPVVAWPAGGSLDLIRYGINGVFVQATAGDKVQAVVDAMERAWYMNRELVRKYAESWWSINQQLDAYEAALADCAKGNWW